MNYCAFAFWSFFKVATGRPVMSWISSKE
jgi:hypothetical protein